MDSGHHLDPREHVDAGEQLDAGQQLDLSTGPAGPGRTDGRSDGVQHRS